jgi:hypothetical protein
LSSVGLTITATRKRRPPASRSYECDARTFGLPHLRCFPSCGTECSRLRHLRQRNSSRRKAIGLRIYESGYKGNAGR